MKKIKYYLIASLILILVGMLIAFNLLNKKEDKQQISLMGPVTADKIVNVTETMKKLKLEQIVVQQIKQSQELIVMEIDLSESTTWDESWGEFDLFKKMQEINFYGKGIYTTDLAAITDDDIHFSHKNKTISINALKPIIKSIELDECKTTYSLTEKGLFRFGDIKITPAQNQMITQQVKAQMEEKMNSKELYDKAVSSAESKIKDLFTKILTNTDLNDYKIEIIWKEE